MQVQWVGGFFARYSSRKTLNADSPIELRKRSFIGQRDPERVERGDQ
jgi:hypothetical protein